VTASWSPRKHDRTARDGGPGLPGPLVRFASYLRIEERELGLVVDSCPSRVGHRSSST
jgi:hypothetical protein